MSKEEENKDTPETATETPAEKPKKRKKPKSPFRVLGTSIYTKDFDKLMFALFEEVYTHIRGLLSDETLPENIISFCNKSLKEVEGWISRKEIPEMLAKYEESLLNGGFVSFADPLTNGKLWNYIIKETFIHIAPIINEYRKDKPDTRFGMPVIIAHDSRYRYFGIQIGATGVFEYLHKRAGGYWLLNEDELHTLAQFNKTTIGGLPMSVTVEKLK